MSTPTTFERNLLANAISALEMFGVVMVPAEMVNAVWQSFTAKYRLHTVEVGVVGNDEQHNAQAVYECLQRDEQTAACWVRCPRLQRQWEERQVEPVQVTSQAQARELLKVYRTEGLEYADECALLGFLYKRNKLDWLNEDEAVRCRRLLGRGSLDKHI